MHGALDASADVSASMAAPVLLSLRARERCRVAFLTKGSEPVWKRNGAQLLRTRDEGCAFVFREP